MGFTFVSLTLFLYLCSMKNGDIIDFDRVKIIKPKDFRFCIDDWFTDADFNLTDSWSVSFYLKEDGTAIMNVFFKEAEGFEISEEDFYNKNFFYSGRVMKEYTTLCQCPDIEKRNYCEMCDKFKTWEYKK